MLSTKPPEIAKSPESQVRVANVNNGIVNIIVSFAPLKPAEFVIIKIQQIIQTEARN